MEPTLSEKQSDLLAQCFEIVSVTSAPGAVGAFIHLKGATHLSFSGSVKPELVIWRRQSCLPKVIYSNQPMNALFKAWGADFEKIDISDL